MKWACDRCLYQTGYEELLQKHMKEEHGIIINNGRKLRDDILKAKEEPPTK